MELHEALLEVLQRGTVDEVDFLPNPEPEAGTSPEECLRLSFVAEDVTENGRIATKLGVCPWALVPMYAAVTRVLREEFPHGPQPGDTRDRLRRCLDLTTTLLLVNAECYTLWNRRREVLTLDATVRSVREELRFTATVLTKHPKDEEVWAYRRWLVLSSRGPANNRRLLPEEIAEEFAVCDDGVRRHSRNYYAWAHRRAVVGHCEIPALLAEVDAQTERLATNPSEASALSFILFALQLLLERDAQEAVAAAERHAAAVEGLLRKYPVHEGLWSQLRGLHSLLSSAKAPRGRHLFGGLEDALRRVDSIVAEGLHVTFEADRPTLLAFAAGACQWLLAHPTDAPMGSLQLQVMLPTLAQHAPEWLRLAVTGTAPHWEAVRAARRCRKMGCQG